MQLHCFNELTLKCIMRDIIITRSYIWYTSTCILTSYSLYICVTSLGRQYHCLWHDIIKVKSSGKELILQHHSAVSRYNIENQETLCSDIKQIIVGVNHIHNPQSTNITLDYNDSSHKYVIVQTLVSLIQVILGDLVPVLALIVFHINKKIVQWPF